MLERELQEHVEGLIARGELLTAISGWEEIDGLANLDYRAEKLLVLDDLVVNRWARAALSVRDKLSELVPVADSHSSISLDRTQKLFTDLLYISPGTGAVVVFEIKRDRAAARETATELLAYEHEIRNHLHFAARTDIFFVVVSTDYSTLLDHSLLSIAAWHGLQVLCIQAGNDKKLSIHVPQGWTSLGQSLIPARYIETKTLSFVPSDRSVAPHRVGDLLNGALDIIARDADRHGATGFGLLWEDTRGPHLSGSPYGLTVARVNPALFITSAKAANFLGSEGISPLQRRVIEHANSKGWHPRSPEVDTVSRFLSRHGTVQWMVTPTWEELRSDRRHCREDFTLDRLAVPIAANAWGLIGDYVRELLTSETPAASLRGYGAQVVHQRTPELVLRLVDVVAGDEDVVTFGARWVCGLALRLSRLTIYLSLYRYTTKQATRNYVRSQLAWIRADLTGPLAHIRSLCLNGLPPEPLLPLGTHKDGEPREDPETVNAYIRWVGERLLGPSNMMHRFIFEGAVSDAAALDQSLPLIMPSEDFSERTAAAARRAANWLILAVTEAPKRPNSYPALTAYLADSFDLPCTDETDPDDILPMIDDIPVERLLDEYTRAVPHAVDIAVSPPHLDRGTEPYSIPSSALALLRRRVLALRASGKYPCLYIHNDGEYGIILASAEDIAMFGTLTNEQVIVQSSPIPGTLTLSSTTWKSLGATR